MSDAVSLRDYVDVRFEAQDRGVQLALSAAEKAVIKAENAAEKRFELLNELRAGVATKEQLEALEKIVTNIDKRMSQNDGKSSGLNAGWGILLGAVGLIGGLIVIFARSK